MSIYDLAKEVAEYPNLSPEYVAKMLHKVPAAPVFNRADYLIKASRNKVILDIGASGPMSEELKKVAAEYYGLDIEPNTGKNFHKIDLDTAKHIPPMTSRLEIVIAGEVLEHLSNAGHFLDMVHELGRQVIVTTPNAFGAGGAQHIRRGVESVNREHVAWYSYHTLKVLVERHGFKVLLWGWYNGKPLTAEGLIFHMEPE